MAKENLKGTCPACFGHFVVVKGLIRKHGWSEIGGRQAGVYGQAYHTGECFGVGYEPFEKSTKGTLAFIEYLSGLLKTAEANLAHFSTRPNLEYHGKFRIAHYGVGDQEFKYYSVTLSPGMERNNCSSLYIKPQDCTNLYHPSYDDFFADVQGKAQTYVNHLKADLDKCHTAVKDWEPKDLFVDIKKVRLVHKPGTTRGTRVMFTACNKTVTAIMGGRTLALVSFEPEHVTCPDCLKL